MMKNQMNSILPIWNISPLDQFNLKQDLLGNIQISSLTILCLFLIIIILAFMFYTTRLNLTFNPPKTHTFIKTEFKSSMVYGIPALDIVTIITSHLYSMVSSYATLDLLYQTSGLATSVLIYNIEIIIRGIVEINTHLPAELNNGQNWATLTQMHTHLASHLTQIQGVTHLLQHNIGFSGGSPDLNQLQDLMTRLSGSTRTLLFHFRQVESAIGIALPNSPISSQVWGF